VGFLSFFLVPCCKNKHILCAKIKKRIGRYFAVKPVFGR
jgi:hypothetical protein